RSATYHELRKDAPHKSMEGAVSVAFNLPPVVGDKDEPYWVIEAYSYLLCPNGRNQSWKGRTLNDALALAEAAIDEWCSPAEMEQFEEFAFGKRPDEGDA